MPFPPTTDTPEQITRKAVRNTLVGLVFTFALGFVLCIINTSANTAVAVATLPAVFAAPFVGGLITVVSYTRAPKPIPQVSDAAS